MAIVRRGPAACAHGPECPHSIGPAAARNASGINAAAARSLPEIDGLLVDRAQLLGSGPVERRTETHEELVARLHREAAASASRTPAAPPAAPGAPMHVHRPARPATPQPSRPEEERTVSAAPQPAIPCGACLHEPVCKYRDDLAADVSEASQSGGRAPYRITATATAECSLFLGGVADTMRALLAAYAAAGGPVEALPFPPRAESGCELVAEPSFAERARASRLKGAEHLRKATDEQILEAVRASRGDMEAAGRMLPITSSGARLRVKALAVAGTLPDDVAALLAGRARNGKPKAAVPA